MSPGGRRINRIKTYGHGEMKWAEMGRAHRDEVEFCVDGPAKCQPAVIASARDRVAVGYAISCGTVPTVNCIRLPDLNLQPSGC